HVARIELSELTVDQALPTLEHSRDRHALIERTARDGAYGRIHAGGITPTRKDRQVLHKSEIMTLCPGCPRPPAGKKSAVLILSLDMFPLYSHGEHALGHVSPDKAGSTYALARTPLFRRPHSA